MTESQEWTPCDKPKIGDVLRWNEPLWAAPTKRRGKRDKIGEQQITAELISRGDVFEFKVIAVKEISNKGKDPSSIKENDIVRRRKSSIDLGNCHRANA